VRAPSPSDCWHQQRAEPEHPSDGRQGRPPH
jgi:hypothetical protein